MFLTSDWSRNMTKAHPLFLAAECLAGSLKRVELRAVECPPAMEVHLEGYHVNMAEDSGIIGAESRLTVVKMSSCGEKYAQEYSRSQRSCPHLIVLVERRSV